MKEKEWETERKTLAKKLLKAINDYDWGGVQKVLKSLDKEQPRNPLGLPR